MNILSPGEKIKRLRREIGLRQDELTDDQITRSLISMIENGKRNLSPDTAKIIAKKLNEHYSAIGKSITAEYLMETKEEQVEKLIDNQLMSIDILLENYQNLNHDQIYDIFNKLLSLADQWSIRKHYSKTLLKRGEFNFNIMKYNEALMDFFSSLDYYLESHDFEVASLIYNKIGNSFIKKNFIEEGLLYYHKSQSTAIEYQTSNLNYIKMLTTFNMIICYRKVKKFDLVFKHITSFKELDHVDEDFLHNVILMEANTYRDLSNYEKAKKLYEKLLGKEDHVTPNTLLLIYNNLAILHKTLNNQSEALKYTNMVAELTENKDLHITPTIYCELAKCYQALDQPEEALSILQKSLTIAEDSSNKEALIDIKLLLADLYREGLKNLSEAEKYLLSTEDMLKGLGSKVKTTVYSRIAKYYCQTNQPDRCIKYLDKIHA